MLIQFASLSSPKTARVSPGKKSLRESVQAQLSLHHPQRHQREHPFPAKAQAECEISCQPEPPDNVGHLLHSICQPFSSELVS